ncbi:uncharacterized protein LOC124357150 [Homalodisca vitripennis]|uniref:uncharacterized protein LOC124357150 n=1 Tax=Homalodisca vitripennis TaxID=197043 RepID=UPI001EEB31A0|nr:uncharacterized protein LOC124357150 [Homalodisca vitripennis]
MMWSELRHGDAWSLCRLELEWCWNQGLCHPWSWSWCCGVRGRCEHWEYPGAMTANTAWTLSIQTRIVLKEWVKQRDKSEVWRRYLRPRHQLLPLVKKDLLCRRRLRICGSDPRYG